MAADFGGAGLEEPVLRDLQPPRAQKSGRPIALAEAAARTLPPVERGLSPGPCPWCLPAGSTGFLGLVWCGASPHVGAQGVALSTGQRFSETSSVLLHNVCLHCLPPLLHLLLPKTMDPGVCGLWGSEGVARN